jgi:hypothetical protein
VSTSGCKYCGVVGCQGNCSGSAQPTKPVAQPTQPEFIDLTPDVVLVKAEPAEENPKHGVDPKVYANWTNPDPSTGKTRENCIIPIDLESAEAMAVKNEFLFSIHRGASKVRNEKVHGFARSPIGYISKHILSDSLGFEFLEISRVQNKKAEERYKLFCDHLVEDHKGTRKVVEERVYHGSDEDSVTKIALSKLNRSYTHTKAYGAGAYAAAEPFAAIHHALNKPHAGGRKIGYIVVCKMSSTKIGHTFTGDNEPPAGCDCGGSSDGYDAWFRIIFDDNQACPIYIIKFEWFGNI